MAETTSPDSSQKPTSPGADPTLEDLDKMLAESDPDFLKSMGELESGLKSEQSASGATAPASAEAGAPSSGAPDKLAQSIHAELDEGAALTAPDLTSMAKGSKAKLLALKSFFRDRMGFVANLPLRLKTQAKDLKLQLDPKVLSAELKKRANVKTLKTLPGLLGKQIGQLQAILGNWADRFRGISTGKKVLLFVALGAAIGIPLALPFLSKYLRLRSDEIIESYQSVADMKKEFAEDEEIVTFGEVDTLTNFVVLLPKIVVNVRKSQTSTSNPMLAMELYLEASNQAAAVELQDREREMKDIAQRVAESITYDDWASANGKMKFKLFLRRDVNQVLNKGRLKGVYFKTIFIKP